jgi:hypothetical protein
MSFRVFLIAVLLVAGAASGARAADTIYMGHPVYRDSGYSLGGTLYVDAFPSFAEVSLDGKPIGVANDLQASQVDTRVGPHALTVTTPGYQPTTVIARVVRDWATRVRRELLPAH